MNTGAPFPSDFIWGTATASFQVEGAANEDGRGTSIWDTFCRTPGRVAFGHTGDVATDQYHRYAEDVALMRDLGLHSYRFSVAWPRILPEGYGERNPKGFDYYDRLVDELLANGIEPAVTLYHWDLPQRLQDEGGWPERETALRFEEYAKTVFDALGDRVTRWITMNEPWCVTFLSHMIGAHAPGLQDKQAAYRAIHHVNLAHGLAVRVFREGGYEGEIGTTLNLMTPRPATNREEDVLAADRAADRDSRMFLDPLLGRPYPGRHLAAHPDVSLPIEEGDTELIAGRIDFLGMNYYNERAVAYDPDAPEQFTRVPSYHPETRMGWPIVPDGLYRQMHWVQKETGGIPVYVTENGCAYDDRLSDDGTRVHDPERIDYLRRHFRVLARAIEDGIPLKGYYLWSLIDNFEWAFGYTRRFGIIFCDYTDLRRVPKDSYYFYREVIAGHEPI